MVSMSERCSHAGVSVFQDYIIYIREKRATSFVSSHIYTSEYQPVSYSLLEHRWSVCYRRVVTCGSCIDI